MCKLLKKSLRLLFQRLYNWIKYKTLPPSILFKNRLFVERDSKHRRIFSNFGLSFRNSKWSNYETYNIKLQFRTSFYKYLFLILFLFVIFIFIFKVKKLYIYFYFFNNFSYFFWTSIDTFDYYFSFIVWSVTLLFSMFLNLIYSYFFFNNFSTNKNTTALFSNSFFNDIKIKSPLAEKTLMISKHDYNWILYSWLTQKTSLNDNYALENLFNYSHNKKWWNSYYDFFIKLYKISFFFNLTEKKNSIYSLENSLKLISNKNFNGNRSFYYLYFNNNISFLKFNSLFLHYFLTNYFNYFDSYLTKTNIISFNKINLQWNPFIFNNEVLKYNDLIRFKKGVFFLNDFNFGNLNFLIFNYPELTNINFNFLDQLKISKWNRWLYKYSILHRRILKNSHKLTLSKKLLNSGLYSENTINRNIWVNNYLNKIDFSNNLNFNYNIFYKNNYNFNSFFINSISKELFVVKKNNLNELSLLTFFENSFFWFIKRFYIYNVFENNEIRTTKKINLNLNNLNNLKKINYYDSALSYFLINQNNLFLNFYYTETYNIFTSINFNTNYNLNNLWQNKDIFILFNDFDLISKNNANLLLYILNFDNSYKNNLKRFNYFLFNNENTHFEHFFINTYNKNNLTKISLLNDLIILNNNDKNTTDLVDFLYF